MTIIFNKQMIEANWPPPTSRRNLNATETAENSATSGLVNYTEKINDTFLEIYLEPNNEWNENYEDKKLANFTWRVVEF